MARHGIHIMIWICLNRTTHDTAWDGVMQSSLRTARLTASTVQPYWRYCLSGNSSMYQAKHMWKVIWYLLVDYPARCIVRDEEWHTSYAARRSNAWGVAYRGARRERATSDRLHSEGFGITCPSTYGFRAQESPGSEHGALCIHT